MLHPPGEGCVSCENLRKYLPASNANQSLISSTVKENEKNVMPMNWIISAGTVSSFASMTTIYRNQFNPLTPDFSFCAVI